MGAGCWRVRARAEAGERRYIFQFGPQFGEGIVVNCEPARGDQIVTVAFKGAAGVKRLMLSFAPLEKWRGRGSVRSVVSQRHYRPLGRLDAGSAIPRGWQP